MNGAILIVDDDPSIADLVAVALDGLRRPLIWRETARSGAEYLSSSPVALMILDWEMPGQSGIEFLRELKKGGSHRHLPVIMLTGRSASNDVDAGIRAGAYYYVAKPFDRNLLRAIVDAAINDYAPVRNKNKPNLDVIRSCIQSTPMRFSTILEATELAKWLALICPQAEAAALGLHELMVNAVEHGNLGITNEEKTELLERMRLEEEIERRMEDPAYASRSAEVSFKEMDDRTEFIIQDQGEGFDFDKYLSLSTERAFSQHGRGIAMARYLSFDSLEYSPPGNRVQASIYKNKVI